MYGAISVVQAMLLVFAGGICLAATQSAWNQQARRFPLPTPNSFGSLHPRTHSRRIHVYATGASGSLLFGSLWL